MNTAINESMVINLTHALNNVATALQNLNAYHQSPPINWENIIACRWRHQLHQRNIGYLEPIYVIKPLSLNDLHHIETQKAKVVQNTAQFVAGHSANNVLLTGARGTGKSSLIRAILTEFSPQGLRLIEIDKADLIDLPDVIALLKHRPEKFIIYCDDLSFEEGESSYKAMKSALEGSIAGQADNVLIYATSNRKHLMPEYHYENQPQLKQSHLNNEELHPNDVVEEKISLSERFGIWVSFHPFNQTAYLDIVDTWLKHFGLTLDEHSRFYGLQFALERGSRSGRVAFQFAKNWAGQSAQGISLKAPERISDYSR